MEFNININQKGFMDHTPNISLRQACIMTWLFSFINQHNFKLVRKDIDGVSYTWISLNKIRTELPLLGRISKSTLSRDVTNLVRFGYIKKYIDEDKKLFIALTELYDEIRAEKEEACKEAEKEKFG